MYPGTFPVRQPSSSSSIERIAFKHSGTEKGIEDMFEIISDVRPGNTVGHFFGQPMNPELTRAAARFSGDHNPRHVGNHPFPPPFDEPIAHGVHAFTEGMEALRQHLTLTGIDMKPSHAEVEFRQPVFLRNKPLRYVILPEEGSCRYSIEAYAEGNTLNDTKPVVVIKTQLKKGALDRDTLGYHLYSGWLVSSDLAMEWKGCLFYKYTLSFVGPALEESSIVIMRKMEEYSDLRGRKHILVYIIVGNAITGTADIIPA